MTVKISESANRCEIWVGWGERDCYAQSEEYRQTVRHYRTKNYQVSVFLSGSEPLLPGVTALLDHQTQGGFF